MNWSLKQFRRRIFMPKLLVVDTVAFPTLILFNLNMESNVRSYTATGNAA